MRDVTFDFPVVTSEGFPHGLRCPRCGVNIQEGQPYGSHLSDMTTEGEYITELICVYCTNLSVTIV